MIARGDATTTELEAVGFMLVDGTWRGKLATALVIEGDGVGLEMYEAGDPSDRPMTADALGELPPWLQAVSAHSKWILEHGVDDTLLPVGEPQTGDATLTIDPAGPGLLEVRARLSPPAPGWTWMRLLDFDSVPWEEAAVSAGTREAIGWSADPAARLYLQATFPVPAGPAFAGVAEVWHTSDDGESVRLDSFPLVIPAR
jgi:hypothetical protein